MEKLFADGFLLTPFLINAIGRSYWNLYIQKLPTSQNSGIQLGVYLHRHSLPIISSESGGTQRKSGLSLFPPPSPSIHPRGARGGRGIDVESFLLQGSGSGSGSDGGGGGGGVYVNGNIRSIDLPPLVPLEEQLYRLRQHIVSTAGGYRAKRSSTPAGLMGLGGSINVGGATITGNASPASSSGGNNGAGSGAVPLAPGLVEPTNTVTAAAAALFEDSFSGFVDRRETTRTWFKIYAVSVGPGHEITQFQSAPDDFAVMQSWVNYYIMFLLAIMDLLFSA
jgi:hypothetical protein